MGKISQSGFHPGVPPKCHSLGSYPRVLVPESHLRVKSTRSGFLSTLTHFGWFSHISLCNFAFFYSSKGASHLLLSQSTAEELPWEDLTDKFNSTLGNCLKHSISLIAESFVEEAPQRELAFALKELL